MIGVNRSAWTGIHIVNIILHVILIIASTAAFMINGKKSMEHPKYDLVFLPWVSFGVGILGVGFNQFLLVVLRSTVDALGRRQRNHNVKKLLSFGVAWFFALTVFAADVAIATTLKAIVARSAVLYWPFVFATLGALMTLAMAIVDVVVFFEESTDYDSVTDAEDGALQI